VNNIRVIHQRQHSHTLAIFLFDLSPCRAELRWGSGGRLYQANTTSSFLPGFLGGSARGELRGRRFLFVLSFSSSHRPHCLSLVPAICCVFFYVMVISQVWPNRKHRRVIGQQNEAYSQVLVTWEICAGLKASTQPCRLRCLARESVNFLGSCLIVRIKTCWAWWQIPVIPVIGRLKQEDHEFRPAWATNEFQVNLN
jgi:hypothetical protein